MNIVITGASGFLGRRLAHELLRGGVLLTADGREQRIQRLTLVDVTRPTAIDSRTNRRQGSGESAGQPPLKLRRPTGALRAKVGALAQTDVVVGDVADPELLKQVIDQDTVSIFHLAAVVSGMAESDFDLGLRVNLDATRLLFDTCRRQGRRPRVVFTSSVAVYSAAPAETVHETTAVHPQTSYGTQKAIAELLLNDYTRRGYIDGRALRLPTITVRPGRPNAAASSFASGIIREPLNGEIAVCPVDEQTRLWVMSPSTVIECLIAAHDIKSEAIGTNRVLNLPGMSVTVGEMVASLARVAGPEIVKRIRWEPDSEIARMVASWPGICDASRARALGFPTDDNFDAIVRRYIQEELHGVIRA